jgi:hypothetical protein
MKARVAEMPSEKISVQPAPITSTAQSVQKKQQERIFFCLRRYYHPALLATSCSRTTEARPEGKKRS